MGGRLVSRADPWSASVASSPNRSVEGGWKILSVRIDNQRKFFDLRLDETPVACQERVALRPAKGRIRRRRTASEYATSLVVRRSTSSLPGHRIRLHSPR